MMLESEKLKIVNNHGEVYLLHPNYDEFAVLGVEGLSQPEVSVNISESGTHDGGEHNSSRIGVRPVVINVVSFGWTEAERRKLYRMFPPKSAVELYYSNTQYNVHTTAYVKYVDTVPYRNKTKVRVELVCPDPYLHAVDGITVTVDGASPSCTIVNDADCEIGFTAEITISTTDTPELVYEDTQSEYAEYLGDHTFCVLPGAHYYDGIDLATQTLNIYVNGELRTENDGVTRDLLTNSGGHNYLYVQSTNGGLANSVIGVEHIVDETQNVTDMRHWLSDEIELLIGDWEYTEYRVPSWFDKDKNKIVCEYTRTAGTTEITKIVVVSQNQDGTYTVKFTIPNQLTTKYAKIRMYGSVGGTNVSADTITRSDPGGGWRVGNYTSYILSPILPTYNPMKDIFRVYMGYLLLSGNGYEFKTVTKSDGTTTTLFHVKSGVISQQITFEAIRSLDETDIRGYTQEQIDTSMCLVDGLTLTNVTTGKSMSFPSYQFENGDKIEISTVSGNVHVVIKESTWLEPGTSLLADVFQTGEFFKLRGGSNTLQVSADTNSAYVSATFNAERLYGGV